MLFNSYGFIFLFLPVVLLGFFQLARIHQAYAAAWLAFASLFFYGYWNPAYVGLLLLSIVCNYAFGMWIAKAGMRQALTHKKLVLTFAIAANLSAAGLLQVRELLPRQREQRRRLQPVAGRDHPAARHLVLHLHPDRLPGRRLPGQGRRNTTSSTTRCSSPTSRT